MEKKRFWQCLNQLSCALHCGLRSPSTGWDDNSVSAARATAIAAYYACDANRSHSACLCISFLRQARFQAVLVLWSEDCGSNHEDWRSGSWLCRCKKGTVRISSRQSKDRRSGMPPKPLHNSPHIRLLVSPSWSNFIYLERTRFCKRFASAGYWLCQQPCQT